MKCHLLFPVTLFAALVAGGCAPKDSDQKMEKAGVIVVADGVPSRQVLEDGRVFTFNPTFLTNDKIRVEITCEETNSAGAKSIHTLTSSFPEDKSMTIGFDNDTLLSFTLQKAKQ
jgi:hypothetical protein